MDRCFQCGTIMVLTAEDDQTLECTGCGHKVSIKSIDQVVGFIEHEDLGDDVEKMLAGFVLPAD